MPTYAPPRPQPCRVDPIAAEYFKGLAGQHGYKILGLEVVPKAGQLGNEGTQFDVSYVVSDDGRTLTLRLMIDGVPVWIGDLRA